MRIDVEADWNLLERCNFSCGYCSTGSGDAGAGNAPRRLPGDVAAAVATTATWTDTSVTVRIQGAGMTSPVDLTLTVANGVTTIDSALSTLSASAIQ